MRLDAASREGNRIRRERCTEKKGRDFESEYSAVMREIATLAGLGTVETLPPRILVFSHVLKSSGLKHLLVVTQGRPASIRTVG